MNFSWVVKTKRRASVALGAQGIGQPFAVAVGTGTYTGDGTGSKIIQIGQRIALLVIAQAAAGTSVSWILVTGGQMFVSWSTVANVTRTFIDAASTYVSGTTIDVGKIQANSPGAAITTNTNAAAYTWGALS